MAKSNGIDPTSEIHSLRSTVNALNKKIRELNGALNTSDTVIRIRDGELEDMKNERDSARAIARVLAHSYMTDNRPPRNMVDEALGYPVRS